MEYLSFSEYFTKHNTLEICPCCYKWQEREEGQEEKKYGIERKTGWKKKGGERTRQRKTPPDSNKIHLASLNNTMSLH